MLNLQVAWEMISDSKIKAMLENVDRNIDENITRFMFIELFNRIKKLEEENIALQVLMMEEDLLEEELFDNTLSIVRASIEENDQEKARESDFFSSSGVPFHEWVNFKITGRFDKFRSKPGMQ